MKPHFLTLKIAMYIPSYSVKILELLLPTKNIFVFLILMFVNTLEFAALTESVCMLVNFESLRMFN